jgi:hypothetical protein
MLHCSRQVHKTAVFFYTNIAPFMIESAFTVTDISVLIRRGSTHKYKSYRSKDFFSLLERL